MSRAEPLRTGRCRCGHPWPDHQLAGDLSMVCDRCDELGQCDVDSNLSVPDCLVADPGGWDKTSSDVTLKDMTLAKTEVVCPDCWLVHRPGTECP